jgi:thioredoxin 1
MASGNKTVHITSAFSLTEFLASNKYVIIEFFGTWCTPSKVIKSDLNDLAKKHSIPGIVGFAIVDIDANPEIRAEYGVNATPTFIFIEDAMELREYQFSGADRLKLKAKVDKITQLVKELEKSHTTKKHKKRTD